jgi:hypothetical protein
VGPKLALEKAGWAEGAQAMAVAPRQRIEAKKRKGKEKSLGRPAVSPRLSARRADPNYPFQMDQNRLFVSTR